MSESRRYARLARAKREAASPSTPADALGESLDRGYLEKWASRLGLEARLSTMLGDDDPGE